MIVGSLFSGIGGLDHGLHRAGFRHAFFCESDPWRRTVLAAHWPGVPVYADVRSVGLRLERPDSLDGHGGCVADEQATDRLLESADGGPDPIGALREPAGGAAADGRGAPADGGWWEAGTGLLSGGFPCQDVSVAGQRRGLAGNRSGLFYEFARIIDALRPRWILVENVPGLFSSNGGRDFGAVVGTLADLGYGLGWRVLDSRYFGVPQRRRRVFILGTVAVGDPRAAAERAGEVLAVGTRCDRHPPTGGEEGPAVAAALAGRSASRLDDQGTGQLVAHALTAEGHDASEDGTGRGAATLSSGGHPNSNGNLVTPSLTRAMGNNAAHPGNGGLDELASATAMAGAAVRRLTPTECERLQALPDGWTNPDGTAPDSRRYAALGDAVTSSVGEWIGRRIIAAETAP